MQTVLFFAHFYYNTVCDYVKYFCITFVFLCSTSYLFCGISCIWVRQLFLYYQVKRRNCSIFGLLTSRAAPLGQTARAARVGGRPRGRGVGRGYAATSHKIQATFCVSGRVASIAQNGDFVSGARADALAEKKAAHRAAVIRPRASVAVGVAAALCRSLPRHWRGRRLRAATDKVFPFGIVRVILSMVFLV